MRLRAASLRAGVVDNVLNEGLHTAASTARAYGEWAATSLIRMRARASALPPDPKGILLLATHLPPSTYGGVYRPLHFIRHAVKRGWNITAICERLATPSDEAGRYLESTLPDAVAIHRFIPADFKPSWRAFPWVDGGFVNSLRMVTSALTQLRSRPAVVLATAPRFYSFPAAFMLAQALQCRLALDYRDEWTECPFDFVTIGNADRTWEERCLARADAVIYTTESIRRHAAARFGEFILPKSHVVPNGWDEVDFATHDTPSSLRFPEGKVTLSFLGSFNNSSPASFLGAISYLLEAEPRLRPKVSIHFVGPMQPEQESLCKGLDTHGVLTLHRPVAKSEATAAMTRSSALLSFIGSDLARYIPQKIYEYAASRRPILLYGYEGEASRAVLANDLGYFVKEGDVSTLAYILEKLSGQSQMPDSPVALLWLEQHRRERLTGKLLHILTEALQTQRLEHSAINHGF